MSSSGNDALTELARFRVRFALGTAEIIEAYASLNGSDITGLALPECHEPLACLFSSEPEQFEITEIYGIIP